MAKNKRLWVIYLAISAVLVATIVFVFSYNFNNKYTAKGVQPINGVLVLDEQEIEDVPVHYLIREWECYPNVILNPSDFKEGEESRYRRYISVGQYTGMELGQKEGEPHGSATYRLTLSLPTEEKYYAIRIPVIYSAYHMYVNDTLLLSTGDPNPDGYRSELQSHTIVFSASENVQLLIAVTDNTWLYSGMVYPLAFGLAKPITHLNTIEIMMRSAVLALTIVGVILFLYAGVVSRWRQGVIFALIGICFVGYLAPSLIHLITSTQGQYANVVLVSSLYAMLGLSVYLQCDICNIGSKLKRMIAVIFGIVTIISLGIGLFSPVLNLLTIMLFSGLSTLIKWTAGILLIAISAYGAFREKPLAKVLLWVSLFFGLALIFDRAYPLYEPIYGGWFMEIGGLVLILGFAFVLWRSLSDAYKFELTYGEHLRQTHRLIDMQKVHYQHISEQMETVRVARHDLRHHMRLLQGLAGKDDILGLKQYLDEYKPSQCNDEIESFTGHMAADAVLCHYAYLARDRGIKLDARLDIPTSMPIPDEEFCILLGNLLENAVEACTLQLSGKKIIYLRCEIQDKKLRLVLDNSFTKSEKKSTSQGLGLKSVEAIVKRHSGMMMTSDTGNLFRVSLLMVLGVS